MKNRIATTLAAAGTIALLWTAAPAVAGPGSQPPPGLFGSSLGKTAGALVEEASAGTALRGPSKVVVVISLDTQAGTDQLAALTAAGAKIRSASGNWVEAEVSTSDLIQVERLPMVKTILQRGSGTKG